MFELTEKELEILEKQEWDLLEICDQDGHTYVEIENWSPAGEDLSETIWIEDGDTFAKAVRRWANSFDKDDHVELWCECRGKRGVPETIRELVDDADAIQKMFNNLADALEEAESDEEYGELRMFEVPLIWKMYGSVYVKAGSKKEAAEIGIRTAEQIIPDGKYMDGTMELDPECEVEVFE